MAKKKVNKIDGITRAKDTKEVYWGQYDANPNLYTNGSGEGQGQLDMFEEGVTYEFNDTDNLTFGSDYGAGGNAWADPNCDYAIDYKFNEKNIIDEMQSYIDSTYQAHYSENKFQATEFIFDGGHAEGFCIGNILKYAQRYGKKGSPEESRKDLQKVIHYAIMAIHNHDLKN